MATFDWHSTDNCWQFITQSIHLCVLFCIVPRIHLWQPIHVRPLFADNALFLWIPHTHTHTHPFNGPSSGATQAMCLLLLPRWAGTRKVKPIWILLKQETVCGNGISWAICKSAPRSRQITTPAPHHSRSFFTGRMHFLPPNQQRQSTEGFLVDTSQTQILSTSMRWLPLLNHHFSWPISNVHGDSEKLPGKCSRCLVANSIQKSRRINGQFL